MAKVYVATQASLNAIDTRVDVLETHVPTIVATTQPPPPCIWFEVDGTGALEAIWNVT
jgi:hypothetical protein